MPIKLVKPTKNDIGLVQCRLNEGRVVHARYRGQSVLVVRVRPEGVVIVMGDDKFIVPNRNIKLVYDLQLSLRTE